MLTCLVWIDVDKFCLVGFMLFCLVLVQIGLVWFDADYFALVGADKVDLFGADVFGLLQISLV